MACIAAAIAALCLVFSSSFSMVRAILATSHSRVCFCCELSTSAAHQFLMRTNFVVAKLYKRGYPSIRVYLHHE
eukprot:298713-Amphidinium_carterae.1